MAIERGNMKKIIHKIAGLALGLSLAMGVGVALASHKASEVKAESFSFAGGTFANSTITWSDSNLQIYQEKVSGGTAVNQSYITNPRWYVGHRITFTPLNGANITSVVFTATGGSYTLTTSSTYANATATISGTVTTITPTDGSSAFSVTVAGNQARPSSLTYELSGGGGGGTPATEHAGTQADPYTVADARIAIDAGGDLSNKYVAGKISQIDSYNSTYKSIQYWISDDGTKTNQLECYSGKGLNGADFSSKDNLVLLSDVVVCGTLKKFGSTYEFDKNNYLVSYTEPVIEITHSVTFNANGGSISPANKDVGEGTKFFFPSAGTLENNLFKGWSSDNGATFYQVDDESPAVTADITYKAFWQTEGTVADPYTVAEAFAAIDGNYGLVDAHVSGKISQIDSFSSQYKSIQYWISTDGTTTTQLECYSGKGLNGADFASKDDLTLGYDVVVCGTLKKHETTYEFDKNNYLVSYEAPVLVLDSITLSGSYKTSFEQNEAFNYEGLVVTANYEGGSSKVVTPTTVSSPDMTTTGEKTVTVSYTENEVTKTAEYKINVTAPATKYTVSFLHGEGSGTMESVQVSEGEDYTLPACTFTAPEGKVFDHWEVDGVETTQLTNVTDDVEVVATWKDAPSEVTDILNNANTVKNGGTTYSDWTTDAFSSGAVYKGNSAGSNSSIQLRSSNSNSGVVSTTSGGTLVSVKISFNSETAATRTVQVFGHTQAYSAPSDLYASTSGTSLGEINFDNGATQTINVEGNFQYVGIRSKSGALYIDSIEIVWGSSSTPPVEPTLTGITVSGAKTDFTVGDEFETTGLVVTAHYEDSPDAIITTGYTVDSNNVDSTAAGTYAVSVSYGGFSDSYDVTYSDPTPVIKSTYKKIKTNLANFSGEYLVVYESSETAGFAFNGSLTTFDATNNGVAVTISNETIQVSEEYEFTIAKKEGGYSLQSKSGYYLGKTAYANAIDQSDTDKYTNQVEYSNNTLAIHGEGNSSGDYVVLRYNADSGQNRFRFMKNNGKDPISLYQKVDAADALALDLLNKTYGVCSQGYDNQKSDFEEIWSTLGTAFNALTPELQSKLAGVQADKDGVMLKEAMARYELLVNKYGLDEFIAGHTFSSARTAVFFNTSESNSSMAIIIVVSLVSISSLGILLVIKKRRVTQ